MGGKKKYIEMFGSFREPFNFWTWKLWMEHELTRKNQTVRFNVIFLMQYRLNTCTQRHIQLAVHPTVLRYGHFPGGSELANIRMSPFWILLELRMMELVVTTGATRRVKFQSYRNHQQTNIQFFYRPDARPVAQLSFKSTAITKKIYR